MVFIDLIRIDDLASCLSTVIGQHCSEAQKKHLIYSSGFGEWPPPHLVCINALASYHTLGELSMRVAQAIEQSALQSSQWE